MVKSREVAGALVYSLLLPTPSLTTASAVFIQEEGSVVRGEGNRRCPALEAVSVLL